MDAEAGSAAPAALPSDPGFVHLRVHSEYSVTDGIVQIDRLIGMLRDDAQPACALTDLGNLFGLVKFYQAARGKGIKPLCGCDVWIAPQDERGTSSRLLLLVRSRQGFHNLCELLSRAYRSGQRRGQAEIDRAWLGELGQGLLALSGAAQGDVGQSLLAGQFEAAVAAAAAWSALFPGNFYLEVQRSGQPQEEALLQATVALAGVSGLPLVATHPIQFLQPDDFKAHEARVCIGGGWVLSDKRRPHDFTPQQHFRTRAEMAARFADLPVALANSVVIAQRCNLELELGKPRLPDFPTPDGSGLDEFMLAESRRRLEVRLEQLFPDPARREAERPAYEERLAFETNTIVQMGFSGYFLIVADFINWAKHNGVPVGPGRGSGAGSLVAYCLGITDLDPIRYDLLFERFLNPERVSMPDFDVDFCQDGRERVIEYVRNKYGADCVSQIATFGTMAAKAVVRDVGRVLDLPYNFVDQLAKLVPFELGMTLARARELEPQLNERAGKEEEVAELLALAEKLEGITRNVGMHAGGVLIAPGRLTDFTPLYCQDGATSIVSQFDKDDVEKVGLVKFDFLGLRTLTILDWAVRYIHDLGAREGRAQDCALSLEAIPLDDPATYALFTSGNTSAVFQQESRTARDLEKRLRPDNFEDIIALMALNRPGPLQSGMVDDFIARKHGEQRVDYFHSELEPILKPTYGVIVYQEQVMQIAQVLAGYSLGSADLLRRAMGKKLAEEMAKQRLSFCKGATDRGVSEELAGRLFDLMEKFAEYGFNKSHSAAYALVSYQTAWLKRHHCAAFMAATQSADMDDTDKVRIFVEDAIANGINVLGPDVNASGYRFVPMDRRSIRYGLGAIKGSGENAALEIVRCRQDGGAYRDLFDFCIRVDKKIVNRRVIEALVKAGAFDFTGEDRATLFASVGRALEVAELAAASIVQSGLFSEGLGDVATTAELVRVKPWSLRERLQNEKACLGYYFSGHPFEGFRSEVQAFIRRRLCDVVPQYEPVVVAGVVYGSRVAQTRRGRMGIVELDDGSAKIEVTVFAELFDRVRALIREDQLLVVEGKPQLDGFTGGIRLAADQLYDLAGARARFARALAIRFGARDDPAELGRLLAAHRPGATPVRVHYQAATAGCQIELPPVALSETLLTALAEWLGEPAVQVSY
ncbi:MAG: DNA polymerase III subunit alpha [Pseudomonadota bacterium]|nr:DNA polymerase III subunit alpha [Pseudomonadota bacterium]